MPSVAYTMSSSEDEETETATSGSEYKSDSEQISEFESDNRNHR